MNEKVKSADYFLTKEKRTDQAFVLFYENYSPFVYSIALKILKDEKEAEDLVQDLFIEIYRHPDQYQPSRGSVKAWISVKTRSRCLDRLRKRKELAKEEIDIQSEEVLEEQVVQRLEWEKVKALLLQLPEKHRNAIVKNYFYDQSHAQIAAHMKKPLGTVKSWIRYGLKSLQKQWKAQNRKGEDHRDL